MQNRVGWGPLSEVGNVATGAMCPSAPPPLRFINHTSNSITVQWGPADDRGSDIVAYVLVPLTCCILPIVQFVRFKLNAGPLAHML